MLLNVETHVSLPGTLKNNTLYIIKNGSYFDLYKTNATGTPMAYQINNIYVTGKAGGQSVIGGTGAGENLTLISTSNAAKGKVYLGAAQNSYFDGSNENLVIKGTGRFQNTLNLAAGTISIAPLNIPSGTLNTSPVSGNIENDGSALSYTNSGGIRKQVATQQDSYSKQILFSHVQLSNPANTTIENTVYTAIIPANSIGANGMLQFWFMYSCTNSANTKNIRIRINGTTIMLKTETTVASGRYMAQISNRNAVNSQIGGNNTGGGTGYNFSSSTGSLATFAFNTATDLTLTVSLQTATSGEVMALEDLSVIAYY